jgi:photosystem II stability/assembly factor-like uncharacterized protein
MSRVFLPGPIALNGFASNPPQGGIVPFNGTDVITGFISTPASYGVSVLAYEVQGRAYLQFNRMYGNRSELRLHYSTSDGTAVAGVDYTATSGVLIWADGDISPKAFQVPLLATSSIVNKSFNVTVTCFIGNSLFPSVYIFQGGNYTTFPSGPFSTQGFTFPVTIVRQGNGSISFVGTPYSVARPGGTTTVVLQVQRTVGFKGAIGCSFHTTNGTAIAGVAYTAQTGTLSFANGDAGPKSITITILSGGSGTQSFTVTIDTPTGGVVIGSTPTATVNIVAAGPPPNPVPTGSVPNQIVDNGDTDDTTGDAVTTEPGDLLQSALASVINNNILINVYGTTAPRIDFNDTFWTSTTVGWAVGDGGAIFKSTDGGVTWTIQASGTNVNLYGVFFASSTVGWAVGAGGVILTTSNGGTTWTPQTSGVVTTLNSVAFTNTTNGWVVGDNGVILVTTNGGSSWAPQASGVGATNLNDVYFVDGTHALAVGDGGTTLFYNGTTWGLRTSGTLSDLNGVTMINATNGWAVGDNGVILFWNGSGWAQQVSPSTANLYEVDFASATVGWAVGANGTILVTGNGGSTWTTQTSGVTVNLNSVAAASTSIAYVVGDNGTFLVTGNGGVTWTPTPIPAPIGVNAPTGGSFNGSGDNSNYNEGFLQTTPFRFQGSEY